MTNAFALFESRFRSRSSPQLNVERFDDFRTGNGTASSNVSSDVSSNVKRVKEGLSTEILSDSMFMLNGSETMALASGDGTNMKIKAHGTGEASGEDLLFPASSLDSAPEKDYNAFDFEEGLQVTCGSRIDEKEDPLNDYNNTFSMLDDDMLR